MSTHPLCIVYCPSWCGDCNRALRWLDEVGYEYEFVDIDEDPVARARCVELAGKVITPTFEIGGITIVGFDPRAVAEALGEPRA